MASKNSTVTITVLGDVDDYKRKMAETAKVTDKSTKEMGKSTDESAKKMSNWAKGAVLALGVVALNAIKNFVKDAVRAFVDLNESLNAVEVTFGDASEGILKLGEGAATSIGMSNAQFNSFAVSISAFAQQIAGDSGDVVGVVEELTGRVADFASVMNLDVADAQEKFQSGLAGESEPLRKFGIDVSAAKVEAYALSAGIWDGVGAMTEAEKVQARFGTIMEQTSKVQGDFANTADDLANATRIANAQIENNKALVGEALQGAYAAALPSMVDLSSAAADVAIRFLEVTGAMDDAEAALKRFQLESGEAVDNITAIGKAAAEANPEVGLGTDLIDLWTGSQEKANEVFRLGIQELDLLETSVRDQRNEIKLLIAELELGEETEAAWIDILEEEIVAQGRAERSAGQHRGAIDRLGEGIDAGKEKTEAYTTALQLFEDEVRSQTDPMYGLLKANQDLADAQQNVVDKLTEFGDGSPEHIDAVLGVAQASEDLTVAQIKVAEQSGFTAETFATHLRGLGTLTTEQIAIILAEFAKVNAFQFANKYINVGPRITGDLVPGTGGRYHDGGVITGPGPRGSEIPILAKVGETVLPTHKPGWNGNGGGTVINLSVTSLDPQAAGRAVVEALQSWQRSNGAVPITVRSA